MQIGILLHKIVGVDANGGFHLILSDELGASWTDISGMNFFDGPLSEAKATIALASAPPPLDAGCDFRLDIFAF
jgi:hypothetical protein